MPQNKIFSEKNGTKRKKLDKKDLSHPYAFKKLPYHIQHSRPMDYRWVEYDYASYKAQEWGIKSARQWRAFVQFFNPAGMPSNPPRAYPHHWESWDTFLNTNNTYAGYDEASVKVSELLPYNEAVQFVQPLQFPTVEAYMEAWDDGVIPKGIPRQPQVRYKEFYPKGGWKYFLGKKVEHMVDAKKAAEPVCALCQTVGISPNILSLVIDSRGGTSMRQQLEQNDQLIPVKGYFWYHDYGTFVFELLDKMGTKQTDNSWLFPDLNALFYELGSVLEEYRPR